MRIKILKYVLIFLTLLMSFLAWQSVDQAINVSGSSIWGAPVILFSLLFIFLYLSIVLIRRILFLQLMIGAIFLLNLVFAFSLSHILIIMLAYLLATWSVLRIKRDLRLNVKVSLWKSIRMGSAWILLALAIVITSQYYYEIKNKNSELVIPQINIDEASGGLTSKFLSAINPEFKDLDQDGLTVDQLIVQIQKKQNPEQEANVPSETLAQIDEMIENSGVALSPEQKKELRDNTLAKIGASSAEQDKLILQEGRKKFSEIAGTTIKGDEKVSQVLSDVVNQKINQYLGSGLDDSQKSSPLPFIMAIGLFLTILPLGSLLNTLWILIVAAIVWIFIKSNLISIARVPVEMEVIEQD